MSEAWTVFAGAVFGGSLRLAPEILKWLRDKTDKAHELAMMRLMIEREKAAHAEKMAELAMQGQASFQQGALDALMTAARAEVAQTGVPWIDALSATVRPVITYWWMALFTGVLAARAVVAACGAGDIAGVLAAVWGQQEMTILSGIINFWFLDRVIAKRG